MSHFQENSALGQTEITNGLPFQFGLLHLVDRDGAPVAVAITKATFTIADNGLELADEQVSLLPSGKPWGEPGKSSYQYEPECSYHKPATDVVLIGAAVPTSRAATRVEVSFSVGPLRKRAIVFGDRFWMRGFPGVYLSSPEPFEDMPLVYERAFGGWDKSDPDPHRHTFEARNPVGAGYSRRFAPGQDRIALPNIEDPANLITGMGCRPKPVGFGFVSPEWQPRASLAGTYDSKWTEGRMPLLPDDFEPGFLNSASEGLRADGYLRGNEQVMLENCAPKPFLTFRLPEVPRPLCRFRIAGQADKVVTSNLDTVIVNTLDNIVILIWRCHVLLPRGPEFLRELQLSGGQ